MGKTKIHYGLTDEYTTEDSLSISEYIGGLTDFILECSTPMTISIQGDWGTGKTSIMHMVKAKLDAGRVETLWFNTWQYSQFNLGENLAASLLLSLLEGLGDSEETNSVRRTVLAVTDKVTDLIKSLIEDKSIEYLGEGTTGMLKQWITGAEESDFVDPSKAIVQLKDQFQSAVAASLDRKGKEKLVVFIDDLDRLRPDKAVELLEILKLFLDCRHCIYVLAIDYDVIIRGVRTKYGEDFDSLKGEAFFDKIIQVPFTVPIVNYNISSYVLSCLKNIGLADTSQKYRENIEKLILASIGRNPRAIKRIFNAYMLILKIAKKSVNESEIKKVLLFAILCMQNEYEEAYNYLMLSKNELTSDILIGLRDGDEYILDEFEVIEEEREEFSEFIGVMLDCLHDENGKPSDGSISEEELDMITDVLAFSTTTASKLKDNTAGKSKREG